MAGEGALASRFGLAQIIGLPLVFLYLTTIGVFCADAEGAIEKTNQVFQPDERF